MDIFNVLHNNLRKLVLIYSSTKLNKADIVVVCFLPLERQSLRCSMESWGDRYLHAAAWQNQSHRCAGCPGYHSHQHTGCWQASSHDEQPTMNETSNELTNNDIKINYCWRERTNILFLSMWWPSPNICLHLTEYEYESFIKCRRPTWLQ